MAILRSLLGGYSCSYAPVLSSLATLSIHFLTYMTIGYVLAVVLQTS
jgi:hypothetical protein